jgi:molybdate transport system ATP-binding protein
MHERGGAISPDPVIRAAVVRRVFGLVPVLDGVSLDVRGGEIVALLGPNGAGKTTLLRILATLLRTTAGSLEIGGIDARRDPERVRPLLAMVAHGSHVYEDLTARENLRFWEVMRGGDAAPARLMAALAQVELDGVADERVRTFSAGMKRRLVLARVLLGQARVLLLDEPFTGLDVSVQMALRIELGRHLRDFPGVVLLVTHDAIDALTLADRVLVLDEGRVAQVGAPHDVAAQPRTAHVARLVGLNLVRDGDDLIAFTPDAVTVSLTEPDGSSRLHWHGPVGTLAPHGDAVRLMVHAEPDLLADVTPAAAAELELVPGREVWLSAKATAVSRYAAGR